MPANRNAHFLQLHLGQHHTWLERQSLASMEPEGEHAGFHMGIELNSILGMFHPVTPAHWS